MVAGSKPPSRHTPLHRRARRWRGAFLRVAAVAHVGPVLVLARHRRHRSEQMVLGRHRIRPGRGEAKSPVLGRWTRHVTIASRWKRKQKVRGQTCESQNRGTV